ncbi:MAG: NADH-quinone oxidoreductase subunit J [Chloroflexota bacterium]|jgi:NADH-quinone oxidoreductase subunit J
MGSLIIFVLLAIVAIGGALGMILSRNAIYSALFLVLNFATIAVFYIILNAPFIGMVQITVYAGAIMVLFLFVIMLLGAEQLGGIRDTEGWQRILALLLAGILIGVFGAMLLGGSGTSFEMATSIDSSPTALGLRLFEGYVVPFIVTGFLLLASMIGVVVLNISNNKRGNDV